MAAVATDIFSTLLGAAPEGAVSLPSLASAAPAAAPIQSQEERREGWLKQRHGRFTASEFHRLMAYPDRDELPKGARTYAREKAIELLTEFRPEGFISRDMQWGIEREPEAVDEFEARTGLTVTAARDAQEFLTLGEAIGGTPDGLIPSISAGLEIKCPKSSTHLEYFEVIDGDALKSIAPEYYWQCQGLMHITGFGAWFFVSYDPRFKDRRFRLHYTTILRNDDDIALLRNRLELAIAYRDEFVSRYRKAAPDLQ